MTRATWTPDRQTPAVFAELSRDFNPVHMDEEHAQQAGFPTVIIHGMCVVGAAARAAQLWAPPKSMLRVLDVRFAQPVLPDQQLAFDAKVRERDGQLKVGLEATLEEDKRVMSPASFTFGPIDGVQELAPKVVLDASPDDVIGDPYSFDEAQLADYRRITEATDRPADEGVPPMVCLLGMTGALEKAFQGIEPEKPGTWVHLRQQGTFYEPIEANTVYVCRIQGGRTVVRNSAIGAHVTIPFLVEGKTDGRLVSSGSCVLLYSFDKGDEG